MTPNVPTAVKPRTAARLRAGRRAMTLPWLAGLYVLISVTAGAVAGWVWHSLVALPNYLTSDDGSVQITERAQGQVFVTDAIFVMVGLIAGVGLGLAAWNFFQRLGWLVAVIAASGGLLAGGVCWLVGVAQGPQNFAERVAAAVPGEKVPIDFQLHTISALLVWALGAVIPVMLYANLSRTDEESERKSSPGEVRVRGGKQGDEIVRGDLD